MKFKHGVSGKFVGNPVIGHMHMHKKISIFRKVINFILRRKSVYAQGCLTNYKCEYMNSNIVILGEYTK
jgi:hypothetical protein